MIQPAYLKPFWRYYGGKWRAAPRYPKPQYDTIIEPFAGSAGYSMRYYWLNVVLVEKYPVLVELWDWLIRVKPSEVRRIPPVEHVDDLPSWAPTGARHLVGFCMNAASAAPCRQLSAGLKKHALEGQPHAGWTIAHRERVASQVGLIKHWTILEGDYSESPVFEATWFVDPPYNNRAGSYYVHADIEYPRLGRWCRRLPGQTIVCENEGATWLPFKSFGLVKAGPNSKGSREVVWYSRPRSKQGDVVR